MRLITIILLLVLYWSGALGQNRVTDSLAKLLAQTQQDTSRVLLLAELAGNYQFFKSDTAIALAREAIGLAQKIGFKKGEIRAEIRLGEIHRLRGEFPQALQEEFKALRLSRKTGDVQGEAECLSFAGPVYTELGEYRQALDYLLSAKKIYETLPQRIQAFALSNIGNAYEKMGKLDSSLYFQQQAFAASATQQGFLLNKTLRALILTRLGILQNRLGNIPEAIDYYRKALQTASSAGDLLNKARSQHLLAEVYHTLNQPDSSLRYALQSYTDAQQSKQKTVLLNTSSLLAKLYKERKNNDSALYYQEVAMAVNESMFGAEKFRQLQLITLSEQQRIQSLREQQARLQRIILLSAMVVFLLIALMLWRNVRHRQKAYALLQQQKAKTDQALEELKITQAQLIQREKMASLGELTAGIAHEIQNPLNFVNNFAETNVELIEEAQAGLQAGNTEETSSLLNDIKANEQKIHHHGKRADSIVKGMLQHSRVNQGQKEPTDINALIDEHLRLSYQSMRSKDKSFNATIETHFDNSIGKVSIVPQD
ncbi:MAG: tetratricopeptide repeat protein, partial [Flavisolibacter sp.]|nr:tetratricopeptide repeat protein [Flavisolibacter sp.]